MTPGTPGFCGQRLREAREARGLTAISLADLLGVTRQAVSKYEKDLQTPAPDVLEKIQRVLSLPAHYFIRQPRPAESRILFYRSMATATKASRVRAARLYEWVHDIVAFLRPYVRFPEVAFPDIAVPDDPRAITTSMIEDAATQTRRFWNLGDGPISNVVWLLENNGAVISRYELGAAKLDAFSEWSTEDRTPYVVLGADKGSAVRSRFDAGHELGHLVLHRSVSQKQLNQPAIFKLVEDQANRFAGAFLLPSRTFCSDLLVPSLDAMRSLKPKWRAAIGLMIHRISDLGLISPSQARRLWINRVRRGWNVKEPFDDTMIPEEPRFLRRSLDLLLRERIVTKDQIGLQMGITPDDVERLTAMPKGAFSGRPEDEPTPQILRFTPRRLA